MCITVAKQLLIMLIICVLAFLFSKRNKFGDKESQFVSRLLLYFVNPCLIFNAFNFSFSMEKLQQLGFVIAISFIVHLLFTAVVMVFLRDDVERLGIIFTNSGFIGIPLIRGVFGQSGVFYLMGYLAVFNIYLWTFGEYRMSHRFSLKKIVTNPNVIAVTAGIVLFCLPFKLPEVIAAPLGYISDLNTALSMILLGMLFASYKNESGSSYASGVIKVSVMRLVVCSVVTVALVFLVWKVFYSVPDMREMLFVVLIASLCPIGMSVSSFACIFGRDASYAGLMVTATSMGCVITIPVFVKVAELLIPAL
ncbi:MAG: AEC family transporter [Treponema sp.]|nr:AEC family transporter [Treponema sp.]